MAMRLIGRQTLTTDSIHDLHLPFSSLVTRRELCEKLRDKLKYDVITFDYRGFGDSTGKPTETGLVQDALFVYEWVERLTRGQRRIYVWGHSLGAAVACQLAARLSNDTSKLHLS